MIIKPDVIVSWPINCDYPLWRLFIRQNRSLFNFVYVVFTKSSGEQNYVDFIVDSMVDDGISFLASREVKSDEDWRDVAIKEALQYSKTKWVWFTEQDFYPTKAFFYLVEAHIQTGLKVVAVKQDERIHPCSLFFQREFLNTFDLDFGILPDVMDHFGKIQKQLEDRQVPFGVVIDHFKHYNGLSHNWRLISEGQKPNYKPDEFIAYLEQCLDADIERNITFEDIAKKAINEYK